MYKNKIHLSQYKLKFNFNSEHIVLLYYRANKNLRAFIAPGVELGPLSDPALAWISFTNELTCSTT